MYTARFVLHQFSVEESKDLLVAAKISQKDFYLDDPLTRGADALSDIKPIFVKRSTKQTQTAQIFDPLSLIGSVIIKPEMLMQTLWKARVL